MKLNKKEREWLTGFLEHLVKVIDRWERNPTSTFKVLDFKSRDRKMAKKILEKIK